MKSHFFLLDVGKRSERNFKKLVIKKDVYCGKVTILPKIRNQVKLSWERKRNSSICTSTKRDKLNFENFYSYTNWIIMIIIIIIQREVDLSVNQNYVYHSYCHSQPIWVHTIQLTIISHRHIDRTPIVEKRLEAVLRITTTLIWCRIFESFVIP